MNRSCWCCGKAGTRVLEETATGGLRLLLLAMRGSGCLFLQTLAAWNGLGLDTDSYATFQRMVRRLTFAQRADGAAKPLAAVSLARCGHDIEAHLAPDSDAASDGAAARMRP